jgi:Nsp1-like C-terminal region
VPLRVPLNLQRHWGCPLQVGRQHQPVVYDIHNFIAGSAPGTLALTTTTTSAISVAPPSMLKGKSIEEIINRWSTELETHVRDFNKFVTEVAVWDRSLIENGNNVGLPR